MKTKTIIIITIIVSIAISSISVLLLRNKVDRFSGRECNLSGRSVDGVINKFNKKQNHLYNDVLPLVKIKPPEPGWEKDVENQLKGKCVDAILNLPSMTMIPEARWSNVGFVTADYLEGRLSLIVKDRRIIKASIELDLNQ